MKKFFADFKGFIKKGNVLDLAIAVVLGNSFNAIVNSLVNSIIMPLISFLTGGVDISSWKWVIVPEDTAKNVAEVSVKFGVFLQAIINFLIIGFSIFLALKVMMTVKDNFVSMNNRFKKKTINRKEKAQMREMGLDPKNKQDVRKFIFKQEKDLKAKIEKEKQKQLEEAKNNPSEKELLKEIRDLLKDNSKIPNDLKNEKE